MPVTIPVQCQIIYKSGIDFNALAREIPPIMPENFLRVFSQR
ncbi:MAG: hypothetical protein K0R14_885 [Burkholderiales bacterium]|jgi:hypothetical protein|nr:hypothetical protein [Burkholderiales bacterium]